MMAVQELVERNTPTQQKKKPYIWWRNGGRNGGRNGWAKVPTRPTPRNIWRMWEGGETGGETAGKIDWRNGVSQRKNCFCWASFRAGFTLLFNSVTGEFWWRNGGRNGLKSRGGFLEKM